MSNVRIAITFVVVLGIVLATIFQMQLRGYHEITRVEAYVLYIKDDVECQDQLYNLDEVEYRITCENQYLLKSGLSEYTILDALSLDILDWALLEPYIDYE